jgi:hypothetical protein
MQLHAISNLYQAKIALLFSFQILNYLVKNKLILFTALINAITLVI